MVLVTSNKRLRLLCLVYSERVQVAELQRAYADVETQMAELPVDFRLLTDFSRLEHMGLDCVPELGRLMELFDRRGVDLVVRVIPDPRKDPGMKILTIFHYRNHPRVVTCATMSEAAKALSG